MTQCLWTSTKQTKVGLTDLSILLQRRNMLRSLVALCLSAVTATAQVMCPEDAMVVFDGSGSMAETGFNNLSEPRIFEARRAIAHAVPKIAETRRLGLIVYGPGGADGCNGLDLRFPPSANAADQIIKAIDTLQPDGDTALTDAVALASATLGHGTPGAIVLVTDGKETCGGAPCQLAAELAASTRHTVHVIGFKVRGDRFSWDKSSDYEIKISVAHCLADRTGGQYISAETVDELVLALERTLGCQLLF